MSGEDRRDRKKRIKKRYIRPELVKVAKVEKELKKTDSFFFYRFAKPAGRYYSLFRASKEVLGPGQHRYFLKNRRMRLIGSRYLQS